MIVVSDYRKVGKKPRKIRSWVIIAISIAVGIVISILLSEFLGNSERSYLNKMLVVRNQTLEIHFLDDISLEPYEIFLKIKKDYLNDKVSNLVVYYNGVAYIKYNLFKPTVSVLNGNGKKDLAMNISEKLIKAGFLVENYGNYKNFFHNSTIVLRGPFFEELKKLTNLLKITNIVYTFTYSDIEKTYAPIVIIIGTNY